MKWISLIRKRRNEQLLRMIEQEFKRNLIESYEGLASLADFKDPFPCEAVGFLRGTQWLTGNFGREDDESRECKLSRRDKELYDGVRDSIQKGFGEAMRYLNENVFPIYENHKKRR